MRNFFLGTLAVIGIILGLGILVFAGAFAIGIAGELLEWTRSLDWEMIRGWIASHLLIIGSGIGIIFGVATLFAVPRSRRWLRRQFHDNPRGASAVTFLLTSLLVTLITRNIWAFFVFANAGFVFYVLVVARDEFHNRYTFGRWIIERNVHQVRLRLAGFFIGEFVLLVFATQLTGVMQNELRLFAAFLLCVFFFVFFGDPEQILQRISRRTAMGYVILFVGVLALMFLGWATQAYFMTHWLPLILLGLISLTLGALLGLEKTVQDNKVGDDQLVGPVNERMLPTRNEFSVWLKVSGFVLVTSILLGALWHLPVMGLDSIAGHVFKPILKKGVTPVVLPTPTPEAPKIPSQENLEKEEEEAIDNVDKTAGKAVDAAENAAVAETQAKRAREAAEAAEAELLKIAAHQGPAITTDPNQNDHAEFSRTQTRTQPLKQPVSNQNTEAEETADVIKIMELFDKIADKQAATLERSMNNIRKDR